MAKLNRLRSDKTNTVFGSYIEGKEDYTRFNSILTFSGPGAGRSAPGFTDNGTPSKSFDSGASCVLVDNKSRTFKLRGKDQLCCHIKQKNLTAWVPIGWIEYASKGVTLDEDVALKDMNNAIQERMIGDDGICIVIRDRRGKIKQIFKGITGAETVTRRDFGVRYDPKGDFFLTNKARKRVAFFSHKAAGGAKAYQQYAGVSKEADFGNTGVISNHPEVVAALKDMMTRYGVIQNDRVRYRREIKSEELKKYAIYGPNFGKQFGVNNCHVMAQGDPSLIEISDREKQSIPVLRHCGIVYELTFSDDVSLNGDLTHFNMKDYKPVIAVTYRSDKSVTVEGKKYPRIRGMIAPEVLVNTAEWI